MNKRGIIMEIIEYTENTSLCNDLKYWSNSLGELHHYGEYDIEEDELPIDLRKLYNEIWDGSTGSLCYLTEYKNKYSITLINEFDKTYASDVNLNMEELYSQLKNKANELKRNDLFSNVTIALGKYTGFDECHEFFVIMPSNINEEEFNSISKYLYENCYKGGEDE